MMAVVVVVVEVAIAAAAAVAAEGVAAVACVERCDVPVGASVAAETEIAPVADGDACELEQGD